jgi:hypothetical protein
VRTVNMMPASVTERILPIEAPRREQWI